MVTRFAHQTGHFVERRFGWDCHGLPIEFEVDTEYGIKTKQQVLDIGIKEYNHRCRSIVMRYAQQWRETVERSGRWIDFDNDYKTMNPSFMESVWWVFKQLFEKGQVYRGFKVIPTFVLMAASRRLCPIPMVVRLPWPTLRLLKTTKKSLILLVTLLNAPLIGCPSCGEFSFG